MSRLDDVVRDVVTEFGAHDLANGRIVAQFEFPREPLVAPRGPASPPRESP
jgi:hypothetical protein